MKSSVLPLLGLRIFPHQSIINNVLVLLTVNTHTHTEPRKHTFFVSVYIVLAMCHQSSQNLWNNTNLCPEYQLNISFPHCSVLCWYVYERPRRLMRMKGKENWHFFKGNQAFNSLKGNMCVHVSVLCSLPFLHVCVTTWKVCNVSRATLAWIIGIHAFTAVFYLWLTCTQVPRFQQREGEGKESFQARDSLAHTVCLFSS